MTPTIVVISYAQRREILKQIPPAFRYADENGFIFDGRTPYVRFGLQGEKK